MPDGQLAGASAEDIAAGTAAGGRRGPVGGRHRRVLGPLVAGFDLAGTRGAPALLSVWTAIELPWACTRRGRDSRCGTGRALGRRPGRTRPASPGDTVRSPHYLHKTKVKRRSSAEPVQLTGRGIKRRRPLDPATAMTAAGCTIPTISGQGSSDIGVLPAASSRSGRPDQRRRGPHPEDGRAGEIPPGDRASTGTGPSGDSRPQRTACALGRRATPAPAVISHFSGTYAKRLCQRVVSGGIACCRSHPADRTMFSFRRAVPHRWPGPSTTDEGD